MIFVFTVIAVAYACRILGKFDIGGVYPLRAVPAAFRVVGLYH